jgi:type IV secretion system protein VirB8
MLDGDDLLDPKSAYYKEAFEWQEERYEAAIKQRNLGWRIAALLFVFCLVQAFTLVLLVPLKEKVPYTIEVNTTTGETRVAKALKEGSLTQSEVLTKYWVVRYVNARLTYDRQDIEQNYVIVQQLSDKKIFGEYDRAFDPKKPNSPYQIYGDHTTIKVNVKSIAFLDKDTASVRVDLIQKSADRETITPVVITLSFVYTLEPASEEQRFSNPLGFNVTKWRQDAEIASGETK